ncbi:ABC transporter substrate-binding protein [Haloplanus pelagicus]|jgi:NitT/TauT family transport system substrate-binding protein|uniref:ABC transporter substrate-binding protein n=1 Tax=Haloplanus pelagicus TaxID=2949995 RepID=UPI002041B496|nr:ABC transporter substrate-binding protein [Haloplanus sp. HW8-1]
MQSTPTRRSFLVAAGAAGTTGLAGCLGGTNGGGGNGTDTEAPTDTDTPTGTATGTPIPDESSLLLNWKPSGLHVPYFTAKAKGFYEEEGLTLGSIETGEGSTFSAKQVGLGNVDFAVTSSDQVLNINSRGLSPQSVSVVMQKSPAVVFSTRETFGGELTDVEQLAGRTVGTGPGMVRRLTSLLLEEAGVREDVEMVDTGYDTVQQLLSGKVDAAGGVFGDAISAEAQGYTVDSVPVAETIPSYGHVIAAKRDWADSNPEAVRAFLRATARGAAWAHERPAEATDLLVEANGVLAESRDQQRRKWETMAEEFMLSDAVREHGWGWSEAEPWRVVHDALADADALGGRVDPSTVWTNDYLGTDAESVGSFAD